MIIRGATLYSRVAAVFVLFALTLAGCGGGGGNDSFLGNASNDVRLRLLDPTVTKPALLPHPARASSKSG